MKDKDNIIKLTPGPSINIGAALQGLSSALSGASTSLSRFAVSVGSLPEYHGGSSGEPGAKKFRAARKKKNKLARRQRRINRLAMK